MYNPIYKTIKTKGQPRTTTTITIESRDWRGHTLITTRKVTLLDDLEQYDCALCAAVRIEAVLPNGRKLKYERGRI